MLVDTEGFGFSTNPQDFITYGILSGSLNSAPNTNNPNTANAYGDNVLDLGINSHAIRALPGQYTSMFFGTRVSIYGGGAGGNYSFNTFFRFMDTAAGNPQFSVGLDYPTGAIAVFSGDAGGTPLAKTADGVFTANSAAYFYLEIGFVLAASGGGSVVVRVNGTVVMNLTGITTQTLSAAYVSAMAFVVQYNSGGGRMALLHQYWCDATGNAPNNTFLGDVRVQTLLPTANDSVKFTPNGLASNWQNAAKVPPALSTDYNADGTVNDQDTFVCSSMSAALGVIAGVAVKSLMSKSDTGSKTAENVIKSNGTVATGPATALTTAGSQLRTVFPTDPNTGNAWTQAGVNAALPGYRVAS